MSVDDFKINELDERARSQKVEDFSGILDKIETLDDKKKVLYKEIYENAITDRQNSYAMFAKLVRMCEDSSTEHAVHGRTIATYIERMSRANDQLIKLVDVIRKAEEEAENIDPDDMFDKIKS